MPDVDLFVMQVSGDDTANHIALTEAGIVGGKIGVNEHGIALTLNGLVTDADGKQPFRRPYHLRFRDILNSSRLSEAVGAVLDSNRACSANIVLGAAAGEFVNLEVLPESTAYVYPEQGILTHANHLEKAIDAESQFERLLPDTVCRAPRLRRLLEHEADNISVEDTKDALRDHFDRPTSVCRHETPSVHEHEQTITRVSAIIDPTEQTLAITNGPPCDNTYQTVTLDK